MAAGVISTDLLQFEVDVNVAQEKRNSVKELSGDVFAGKGGKDRVRSAKAVTSVRGLR